MCKKLISLFLILSKIFFMYVNTFFCSELKLAFINNMLLLGDTAAVECAYCKGNFDTESLSLHIKRCVDRPVKCPDCLEVILLQKWLYDHECQKEKAEGILFNSYQIYILILCSSCNLTVKLFLSFF